MESVQVDAATSAAGRAYDADPGALLSFDLSRPGRTGVSLPTLDVPEAPLPEALRRDDLTLPEMSQLDVVRYFTRLSQRNWAVDTHFYPLGSCTMKYNPKVNDALAALPGFADLHPEQDDATVQGALELMWTLQQWLAEITGMAAVSLAPAAGAHGELTSILLVRAYLDWYEGLAPGEQPPKQRRVLVPDSAHGTNPATAAMAGFAVESIPSDAEGNMDLRALEASLKDDTKGRVAAAMVTLPSTLGLFDRNITRIADLLHEHGALLYGDGANMNAMLGQVKPGDLGFDLLHLNLHKTFSTPHGGGGPGAGPICVKEALAPFLPTPHVRRVGDRFERYRPERSVGRIGSFQGNFGVLVRAYAYIRSLGADGLREVSDAAVLNANYVQARLAGPYRLPYERRCMHEVVFSGSRQRAKGVRTLDIAKRLIDYGFHPPTVYFPLIVDEALMIEPTETESLETLDAFCDAMLAIAREAEESPELLREAPVRAPLRRLDEATAARKPDLRWRPRGGES
ncbi:MAG TPA: aminomethyl-transferring glycine dehydrogenase subunit GcvPB [Dehalococcoidia bacterium]|nr:aminomethyl-transferring glycine dehydrogenase subunit GcvPB [Dehalococcoidia bacterium]